MALFPAWGDLASFSRVTQALEFFQVEDDVWQAFVHQVGEVREDLRLLAALSRPAVLAGCSAAVLPDGSPLNALQATQVGLVWRLARRVMAQLGGIRESEFVDVEVWLDNPPNSSETSTRTTLASGSTGATNTVKEKVLKMSSLIDQADDSELLPPSNSELNKWHQNYVAIMGAQADESEEPSPNQLAALFKRVFVNDHPPYCDFGVTCIIPGMDGELESIQNCLFDAQHCYFEFIGDILPTHREIGVAVALSLGFGCISR